MPNKGQTEFIRKEMRPAIVCGIGQLLGNFFFLLLLIVPEVFANVNSAQFTSLF